MSGFWIPLTAIFLFLSYQLCVALIEVLHRQRTQMIFIEEMYAQMRSLGRSRTDKMSFDQMSRHQHERMATMRAEQKMKNLFLSRKFAAKFSSDCWDHKTWDGEKWPILRKKQPLWHFSTRWNLAPNIWQAGLFLLVRSLKWDRRTNN